MASARPRRTRSEAMTAPAATLNMTGAADPRYPPLDKTWTGRDKCICEDPRCEELRRNHMLGHITLQLPTLRPEAKIWIEQLFRGRVSAAAMDDKVTELWGPEAMDEALGEAEVAEADEAAEAAEEASTRGGRRVAYIHFRACDRSAQVGTAGKRHRLSLIADTKEKKDQLRSKIQGGPRLQKVKPKPSRPLQGAGIADGVPESPHYRGYPEQCAGCIFCSKDAAVAQKRVDEQVAAAADLMDEEGEEAELLPGGGAADAATDEPSKRVLDPRYGGDSTGRPATKRQKPQKRTGPGKGRAKPRPPGHFVTSFEQVNSLLDQVILCPSSDDSVSWYDTAVLTSPCIAGLRHLQRRRRRDGERYAGQIPRGAAAPRTARSGGAGGGRRRGAGRQHSGRGLRGAEPHLRRARARLRGAPGHPGAKFRVPPPQDLLREFENEVQGPRR